jgi:hypothetical protein
VTEKHPPFLDWLQSRYLDGLRVTMRRPFLVAVVAVAVIGGATIAGAAPRVRVSCRR